MAYKEKFRILVLQFLEGKEGEVTLNDVISSSGACCKRDAYNILHKMELDGNIECTHDGWGTIQTIREANHSEGQNNRGNNGWFYLIVSVIAILAYGKYANDHYAEHPVLTIIAGFVIFGLISLPIFAGIAGFNNRKE